MKMSTLEALIEKERRDYYREWRRKNPDKVRKHNSNYWQKRAEKRLAAEEEREVE